MTSFSMHIIRMILLSLILLPTVVVFDVVQGITTEDGDMTSYIGCYIDNPNMRDLSFELSDDIGGILACRLGCSIRGYSYAGVQEYSYCFCDNTYGRYGETTTSSSSSCNAPCTYTPEEICGGTNSNGIYHVHDITPSPTSSPTTSLVPSSVPTNVPSSLPSPVPSIEPTNALLTTTTTSVVIATMVLSPFILQDHDDDDIEQELGDVDIISWETVTNAHILGYLEGSIITSAADIQSELINLSVDTTMIKVSLGPMNDDGNNNRMLQQHELKIDFEIQIQPTFQSSSLLSLEEMNDIDWNGYVIGAWDSAELRNGYLVSLSELSTSFNDIENIDVSVVDDESSSSTEVKDPTTISPTRDDNDALVNQQQTSTNDGTAKKVGLKLGILLAIVIIASVIMTLAATWLRKRIRRTTKYPTSITTNTTSSNGHNNNGTTTSTSMVQIELPEIVDYKMGGKTQ